MSGQDDCCLRVENDDLKRQLRAAQERVRALQEGDGQGFVSLEVGGRTHICPVRDIETLKADLKAAEAAVLEEKAKAAEVAGDAYALLRRAKADLARQRIEVGERFPPNPEGEWKPVPMPLDDPYRKVVERNERNTEKWLLGAPVEHAVGFIRRLRLEIKDLEGRLLDAEKRASDTSDTQERISMLEETNQRLYRGLDTLAGVLRGDLSQVTAGDIAEVVEFQWLPGSWGLATIPRVPDRGIA